MFRRMDTDNMTPSKVEVKSSVQDNEIKAITFTDVVELLRFLSKVYSSLISYGIPRNTAISIIVRVIVLTIQYQMLGEADLIMIAVERNRPGVLRLIEKYGVSSHQAKNIIMNIIKEVLEVI